MNRWIGVLVEAVLAVLCLVLAVLSWRAGIVSTSFAPSGDVPGFDATRYRAPWLMLAASLVAVAGVLTIDGVTRTMRAAAV